MICGFEHHLRGRIEHIRIVWREGHRIRPGLAILIVLRAVPRVVLRPHRDVLLLLAVPIEPGDDASARAGIDNVGVARIGNDVTALSAARVIPVLPPDVAFIAAAGDADRRVVLLRAVEVIEKTIIGGHVIELRRGLGVLAAPGLAAIHGNGCAAVVAVDHPPGICGIDPQAVMVAMWRRQQLQALAGVT